MSLIACGVWEAYPHFQRQCREAAQLLDVVKMASAGAEWRAIFYDTGITCVYIPRRVRNTPFAASWVFAEGSTTLSIQNSLALALSLVHVATDPTGTNKGNKKIIRFNRAVWSATFHRSLCSTVPVGACENHCYYRYIRAYVPAVSPASLFDPCHLAS